MTTHKVNDDVPYYEILGLGKQTEADFDHKLITEHDIKKAYRKRALQTHPDVAGGDQLLFEQVNTAYEILTTPDLRKKYDDVLEQRSKRLAYERQLSAKSRSLKAELEEREKRHREETESGVTAKRRRLDKEEVEKVRSSGYDKLRIIQEQHKQKLKEQSQLRDKMQQQQQLFTQVPEAQRPTSQNSSGGDGIMTATWKDQIETDELQRYLESIFGPLTKFVRLSKKRKAIVIFKDDPTLLLNSIKLSYGLKLKPAAG